MKLAITVLSSILAICSVTVANPVNPSATTSAESSTSAVIPSAQTIASIDFNQLSDEGKSLIKEYAQANKKHNEAKAMCDSTGSVIASQEKLVKYLGDELKGLMDKSRKNKHGPRHEKEVKEANSRLEEQYYIFLQLENKCVDSYWGKSGILSQFAKIKNQLVKSLFGKHTSVESVDSHIQLLESNPEFMGLVKQFENLVSGQQLELEQPSTSESQNSQHHKSLSSSSDQTPTAQSTKASSGKHETPKYPSEQRSRKSRAQKLFKSSHSKGGPKHKKELSSLLGQSDSEDSDA
ncbi:hypothetical protein O5D80_004434 [Batrachochytrium dendrobatidis]|nr:hypothetical protein O5D80_004434 [Batrachochytrium dendrobatidis]